MTPEIIRSSARLALKDTVQDACSFFAVLAFICIVAAYIG